MPDPVTVGEYTTVDALRAGLKLGDASAVVERAERVVELANAIVFHAVGQAGADAYLAGPTYPAAATESAFAIACDLWRRPTAPGGFVQVADYVGRLAADPTSPVLAQLSTLRLSWAIS